MLEVTRAAADAINAATEAKGVQDTGGLRISVESTTEQGATLNTVIADQPAQGDEVVTADAGPRVFLARDAALYLTDKVLDVEPDADGMRHLSLHGRI
jgi:Fe-S cluster assembly iron-binding protein IscA